MKESIISLFKKILLRYRLYIFYFFAAVIALFNCWLVLGIPKVFPFLGNGFVLNFSLILLWAAMNFGVLKSYDFFSERRNRIRFFRGQKYLEDWYSQKKKYEEEIRNKWKPTLDELLAKRELILQNKVDGIISQEEFIAQSEVAEKIHEDALKKYLREMEKF